MTPRNVQDGAPPRSGSPDPESLTTATETTPLINGTPKPTTENETEAAITAAGPDDEITVLPTDVSTSRTVAILLTVYVGVFLAAIDASIIATLSGPIASELHSLSLLSWLATSYLIANAATQPLSGRLTDIFGRGTGLVFCNFFFGLGNLAIGLSQTPGQVIAGRVIAGIGGGGLSSIATFLASDLVPLRKRGLVQGAGNIAWGGGAMLGGVFGGLINDHTALGWRLAFFIQVPVVAVSGVLVYFLVDLPPKISSRSALRRIDFVGAFSLVTFLVLLLLGLNAGGNLVPWTHPLVLITVPLSFVALLGFFHWEAYKTPQPILPVRLLLDRTVISACLTNLVCTMALMMLVFYIPLYLQVRGWSSSDAGACLASECNLEFPHTADRNVSGEVLLGHFPEQENMLTLSHSVVDRSRRELHARGPSHAAHGAIPRRRRGGDAHLLLRNGVDTPPRRVHADMAASTLR